MTHFSKTELATLLDNGRADNHGKDHVPVARFFLKGIGGTLLITELRDQDNGMAYGLCDVGAGQCKVTQFDLKAFAEVMERHGYDMKRDAKFKGQYPLSVYAKAAKRRRALSDLQYALKKTDTAL